MPDSSFYDSNSERLEEGRMVISGLPEHDANPDWLQKFKSEPLALIRAADDWWSIAIILMEEASQCEVLAIPRGFLGLTNLLALFCDQEVASIDAVPLKDFHDALYAREGELHDLVSSSTFESPEEMESTLRKAKVVIDRLENLAQAKEQEHRRKEKEKRARKEKPLDEHKLEAVRNVIRDNQKATRVRIQTMLRYRGGSGISNDELSRILDRLRETDEYLVPKRRSPTK